MHPIENISTREQKMHRIFDAISQGLFELSKESENEITVNNVLKLRRVQGGRDHHTDFGVYDEITGSYIYGVFTEEECKQIQNGFYINAKRKDELKKIEVFNNIKM